MLELKPDFRAVIETLSRNSVQFVIIGGLAMGLHGTAHVTDDIDFIYARDSVNLQRIVDALAPYSPRLRTAYGEIPFLWDARTLKAGLNFTLRTSLGDVDMLGEAPGTDSFEGIWRRSSEVKLHGLSIRVASVDDLISMKRAANRVQDQRHLIELEALKSIIENET